MVSDGNGSTAHGDFWLSIGALRQGWGSRPHSSASFQGTPFEFWDLVYAQMSSNGSKAEPLLTRSGCESFLDRILAAAGPSPAALTGGAIMNDTTKN